VVGVGVDIGRLGPHHGGGGGPDRAAEARLAPVEPQALEGEAVGAPVDGADPLREAPGSSGTSSSSQVYSPASGRAPTDIALER
jgi:hypothetical protein